MLSNTAEELLAMRYYRKNSKGIPIENWEQLVHRVCSVMSSFEQKRYEQFYELIHTTRFLPNSPTLMGAGIPEMTYSGCFVIPMKDSIHSIMDLTTLVAVITKAGGGVGYDTSLLRPEGALIGTRGGVSSGPVAFLPITDAVIGAMKQGGTRKGAVLVGLVVDHPDIITFIKVKDVPKKMPPVLVNMNLSVIISDAFMEAYHNGTPWDLVFGGKVYDTVDPRELMALIAKSAWSRGEPGVIFIDNIQKDNPVDESIYVTNPCGEQPLWAYTACNLGTFDISKYQLPDGNLNKKLFIRDIYTAVRFMDNVIDMNYYPHPKIRSTTKKYRPLGLGIMGLADYFVNAGVVYGSAESLVLLEEIFELLQIHAISASIDLGLEKGSFPAFELSTLKKEYPAMRNIRLLNNPPAGSISIIAGCSAGIEPIFTFQLEGRNTCEGNQLIKSSRWSNVTDSEVFITGLQVPWLQHLQLQALIQRYVKGAVSKTINLPREATPEIIEEIYVTAHKLGCKGTTVFREDSYESLIKIMCPLCKIPTVRIGNCWHCNKCGWASCTL